MREDVVSLLQEWARLEAEVVERTEGLVRELDEIHYCIQQARAPYEARLATLSAAIIDLTRELGEAVEAEGIARATYRSGYTRYSWDNRALEGYAAAHPEVLGLRKAAEVAASVKVSLW